MHLGLPPGDDAGKWQVSGRCTAIDVMLVAFCFAMRADESSAGVSQVAHSHADDAASALTAQDIPRPHPSVGELLRTKAARRDERGSSPSCKSAAWCSRVKTRTPNSGTRRYLPSEWIGRKSGAECRVPTN